MDTETLDKLYLEWSQFTEARTRRELAMKYKADKFGLVLTMIREGCADPAQLAEATLAKFASGGEVA